MKAAMVMRWFGGTLLCWTQPLHLTSMQALGRASWCEAALCRVAGAAAVDQGPIGEGGQGGATVRVRAVDMGGLVSAISSSPEVLKRTIQMVQLKRASL